MASTPSSLATSIILSQVNMIDLMGFTIHTASSANLHGVHFYQL
jgi:hypothetical protein